MSEKTIQVEVAGSIYPLKIATDDEKNIQEAAELINNKVSEFESNYRIKDKKEVLGMVTLLLVSQLYKQANTAEKELVQLKKLFEEVEAMLKIHATALSKLNEE
jgi:cell division protein ZapA